ncbi:MAG: flagellar type III secretion system pore protein FliP [Isosphaeraceae bacterium]
MSENRGRKPAVARRRTILAALAAIILAGGAQRADDRGQPPRAAAARRTAATSASRPSTPDAAVLANRPAAGDPEAEAPTPIPMPRVNRPEAERTLQTVVLFGVFSLAPVGLLMLTAFVRINIVLTLLRQALGSPQVPGNQVILALSLLLTALVMWPTGDRVYRDAIEPYAAHKLDAASAWNAGVGPVKSFMIEQIVLTRHQGYLETLRGYATGQGAVGSDAAPERPEDYPLQVVAPAFLLSELTTALLMGFYLYLPFLVVDLVVSSILAATGLFMLPPSLVATPIKLILFVLADGWFLVATMLLSSFGIAGTGK